MLVLRCDHETNHSGQFSLQPSAEWNNGDMNTSQVAVAVLSVWRPGRVTDCGSYAYRFNGLRKGDEQHSRLHYRKEFGTLYITLKTKGKVTEAHF